MPDHKVLFYPMFLLSLFFLFVLFFFNELQLRGGLDAFTKLRPWKKENS